MQYRFAGIDPGLIDTGVVILSINDDDREITVRSAIVRGLDLDKVQEAVGHVHHIYAERYIPRPGMKSSALMVQFETELKVWGRRKNLTLVNNTGSRQVVRPALLNLLGLNNFPKTHHQDLESAARILVYGLLKDDKMNGLLSHIVRTHLYGSPTTDRYAVIQHDTEYM